MKNVIVVIGPGQIGQAIARRVGVGKHILLADMRPDNGKQVEWMEKVSDEQYMAAPGAD